MRFFEQWRTLPRKKTKEELDEHYRQIETEKGDMPAMILGAFLAFAPVILLILGSFGLVLWVLSR